VVIEATLANGHGVSEQLTQPGDVALFVEGGRIVGMDPRGSEDESRILLGVFRRESRRRQRLSDADDGRRARFAGAGDYRAAVAGERRVCEVGMAVDEA
jgi:hypothetical protein